MNSLSDIKSFISKHASADDAKQAFFILDRLKEEAAYYENFARHQDEKIRFLHRKIQEMQMMSVLEK